MTDLSPLSPAAQAVMNGLWDADLDCCQSIEHIRRRQAASALRAAADQVVPEFWHEEGDIYGETMQGVRQNILAIAAELEGVQ